MNEQNKENLEKNIKFERGEQKDEEEETIKQVNKQVFGDKGKIEDNPEENIKIIKEDIISNDINNNNQLIETEEKDNLKAYKNLSIQNNYFNLSTNPNFNKNRKNNYIIKTNYHQHTHNKTSDNFFINKFENYNEEIKRYYFNKQYSNFHINKEENFLERMQFDIYKRQIREERLNDLIEQNKVRIDEEKKIKTFNRLIEDANRRLKAKINMNDLQSQLNDDFLSSTNFYKKYNDNEWDEIYKKRFKAYQESINKKKEENKKSSEEEKRKKEQIEINLCPIKKAPIKHILEVSQKMYDEAKKRKIKRNEKLETSININNISTKNINNIKENGEKNLKKNNDYNNKLNQFLITSSKNSNERKLRKKSNSNDKIIIKNKKFIPFKNNIKNIYSSVTPNKYLKSHNSKKSNNKINNSYQLGKIKNDDLKKNCFDLEQERKVLIQMATEKKLPQFKCANKIQFIEKKNLKIKINTSLNNKNMSFNKDKISESDKIIEEFFMRNIK